MDSTRLNGPGMLIAALPSLLGFTPRESVVVVSLRPRGEVGIVLRADRVDCLTPDVSVPLSRSLSNHLMGDGARAAFLVSYTDDEVRLADPAIDGIRSAIAGVVDDVEAWAVVRGRYFSPGCAQESCCPVKGRPVPPFAAPMASPASGHRLVSAKPVLWVEADEADRRRAAGAGARWKRHRDGDVIRWRHRSLALWAQALDSVAEERYPTVPDAGKLIEALQDRRVRDAVLVSLLPGSSTAAEGLLDGSGDEEVSSTLRVLLSPEEGRPPPRSVVAPAYELLGFLTAHARPRRRAPSLTLCAVLAWWEGDVERCRGFLDKALASEPGYRLAGLLECTVLAGIDPGWKRAA